MSSSAARIRWNSFYYFLSTAIRLCTNVLLFVGIARLYGPEAFGQFTTAHTVATLFLVLADFGFDLLLATEIARQREQAPLLARQFFSLKLIFVAFAVAAMVSVTLTRSFSPETATFLYVFSIYVFFSSLNNFFFALFKGFEELQHETKISLVVNALLLCGVVALGLLRLPLLTVAIILVATRIIGLAIALWTVSAKFPGISFVPTFEGCRQIWRDVAVFGLQFLFGTLYFQLDTVLLAFWRGDHDVGIYQSVFKIIILPLIIPDIAVHTLVPVLSRLNQEDNHRWRSLGRLLNKTLLLVGLPISMTLFVYAEDVIDMIYGLAAFGEAVPVLRLFAGIVFVRFSVETFALMLTTSRRQGMRMFIVMGAAVLSIVLNSFLIPRLGVTGAAIVSLTVNICVGISYVLAARLPFARWTFDLRSAIPLVTTLVLGLMLWFARPVSIWIAGLLATIAYSSVFYFVGYSKSERALIFALNSGFRNA